jgi:hypothetical protein
MTYKALDTVVLDRDLPEHGLRAGDLGAVVETYPPDGLESLSSQATYAPSPIQILSLYAPYRVQRDIHRRRITTG